MSVTGILYSPLPPESYVRRDSSGTAFGVGAELAGVDRRAWWNLYWLSDPGVDGFLVTEGDWPKAESIDHRVLIAASTTARKEELGGAPMAKLLVSMAPAALVELLESHGHGHLTVAQVVGAGWLNTVKARALLYRGQVSDKGNVVGVNFGARPVDWKVAKNNLHANGIPATIATLNLRDDDKTSV